MTHWHAARLLAVLLEEQGQPGRDPARAAPRLADQAVNVVTALDYLIVQLRAPASGDEALDHLTRRQLDARATAVRQGTQQLAMLPTGLVIVTSSRTWNGGETAWQG